MSSETARSSSPRWIAAAVAMVFAIVVSTLALDCVGPDAFNRDAGPIQPGLGGNDGFAGQIGSGGSGMGGTGMGGQTGAGGSGAGGKTGAGGGSGMGGALGMGGSAAGGRTGSGGSAMGGAPGTGGQGMGGAMSMGGATGTGGAVVTDGGSDADAPGAGGSGAGGAMGMGGGAGGATVVFSDNFESYALSTTPPPTWTRLGGSMNDWQIVADGSQVLTQNKASTGTTYRACYASSAAGAPWSGATTVSALVKATAIGATPTALLCLRYTTGNAGYCLALLPNTGAQIQVRAADAVSSAGGTTAMTIAVGTQYNVRLSVDGTGVLSGSVNGMAVGPFTPPGSAMASGFVGVATQMAEATFDNVVVTQP